jgi:nicotinamidase/pyrazinamidase
MAPEEKIVIDPATDAIVHVDVTGAFMEDHFWGTTRIPAGGLPVPGGHGIIPVVLKNTAFFTAENRYATVDQHPEGHVSWVTSYGGFAPFEDLTLETALGWVEDGKGRDGRILADGISLANLVDYLHGVPGQRQTLWPKHGPIGSEEAELHPALRDLGFRLVLVKGFEQLCDSYSGVRDNLGRSTGFAEQLKENGVRRVFLDGLAFTHCVGWTALDLAAEGFEVYVIMDATRSVPIPGLEEEMKAKLAAAGVHMIFSGQLASA